MAIHGKASLESLCAIVHELARQTSTLPLIVIMEKGFLHCSAKLVHTFDLSAVITAGVVSMPARSASDHDDRKNRSKSYWFVNHVVHQQR